MTTPRIIHQTWKDSCPHPALACCMESFQALNPDWEWRFYTDEDCINWISDRCPRLLATYQAFQTGIHRSDFFRMLVLFHDGGVYADIDVECLRPLDELLARLPANKTVYLTRDHPVHERAHFGGRAMWMNDFMIAAPGDPLIGAIVEWMAANPPTSSTSAANAVMDTGPGVVSAVIEMLGGPEQIPGLGVIPTHWVHPLPDMNCNFPEKRGYLNQIATRAWLGREVFAVHYWFHTWVTKAETNTLTDYADVLLSTRGEQVERLLQWRLRDSESELDAVIACALAEFAEAGGEIIIRMASDSEPLIVRFAAVLQLSGLRPKMTLMLAPDDAEVPPAVRTLEALGATRAGEHETTGRLGDQNESILLVAPPSAVLSGLPEFYGFILGPVQTRGQVVASHAPVFLSEVSKEIKRVPQVLHLFPTDEPYAPAIAEHLATRGYAVRRWSGGEVNQLLADASMGGWNLDLLSWRQREAAAALLILWREGGLVFAGDSRALAAALGPMWKPHFVRTAAFWFFACEPRCSLLDGTFRHWLDARRRSRAGTPKQAPHERTPREHVPADVELSDFLEIRMRVMHFTGHSRGFVAATAHAFAGVTSDAMERQGKAGPVASSPQSSPHLSNGQRPTPRSHGTASSPMNSPHVLVSSPMRVGSTWVHEVLMALLKPERAEFVRSASEALALVDKAASTVMKSHLLTAADLPALKGRAHTIRVLRNYKDSLISRALYCRNVRTAEGELPEPDEEALIARCAGLSDRDFVNAFLSQYAGLAGWVAELAAFEAGEFDHTFHYEMLLHNARDEFWAWVQQAGYAGRLSPCDVDAALERCAFARMKARKTPGFMGSTGVGQWMTWLEPPVYRALDKLYLEMRARMSGLPDDTVRSVHAQPQNESANAARP